MSNKYTMIKTKKELVDILYRKITREINIEVFGIDSDLDMPFSMLLK